MDKTRFWSHTYKETESGFCDAVIEFFEDTDLPLARECALLGMMKEPEPCELRCIIPWELGATPFYTRISPELSEWCRETLAHPVLWAVVYNHEEHVWNQRRYAPLRTFLQLAATFGSHTDLIVFKLRWGDA